MVVSLFGAPLRGRPQETGPAQTTGSIGGFDFSGSGVPAARKENKDGRCCPVSRKESAAAPPVRSGASAAKGERRAWQRFRRGKTGKRRCSSRLRPAPRRCGQNSRGNGGGAKAYGLPYIVLWFPPMTDRPQGTGVRGTAAPVSRPSPPVKSSFSRVGVPYSSRVRSYCSAASPSSIASLHNVTSIKVMLS